MSRRSDSHATPPSTGARLYARLGGLAFATSLAYFAHVFFVELGRTAGAEVSSREVVGAWLRNALLFAGFALHHSVMARQRAKTWLARYIDPRLERATYVWAASLLFVAVCRWWSPVPGVVYEARGLGRGVGYGVQLAGLALIAWATRTLDVWELSGIRPVLGGREPAGAERAAAGSAAEGPGLTPTAPTPGIRVAGPYRWLRHPIYLGWTLIVFGSPTLTHSRLAFAAISVAYLVMAIPWEERSMRAAFGARYDHYRATVRWRMVPGIY